MSAFTEPTAPGIRRMVSLKRQTCLLVVAGFGNKKSLGAVDRLEGPSDSVACLSELVGLGISIHLIALRTIWKQAIDRLHIKR